MVNGKIEYTSMPSLKYRTLVKITAALWNRSDIRDLVSAAGVTDHYNFKIPRAWRDMVNKVKGIVPRLPLPKKLKREISDLVQPIGLEIKRWKKNYEYHTGQDLGRKLPVELCWTPQGTVQEMKTAELLVKDENLSTTERFRIACVYCLEEEIKELWNSMSQREKDLFDIESDCLFQQYPLIVFWICDVKGELDKFGTSPYQFALDISVYHLNRAAAEFFLQKLTPRERDEALVKRAIEVAIEHHAFSIPSGANPEINNYADILCFLLSHLSEEQQAEVFMSCPTGALSCFLCWPWQSFFMETANRVWDFLPELQYQTLLNMITIKMLNGYIDYDYQKLLGEFWEHSPSTFKEFFMDFRVGVAFCLRDLFKLKDKENIRLIFKYATLEEKEDILIKIKEELIPERSSKSEKGLWKKLFQFLDDIIRSENEKRGVEDGSRGPPKRKKCKY